MVYKLLAACALGTTLIGTGVSAATYSVDAVLDGTDSGFGFSLFHDQGNSQMSGPTIEDFDAASFTGGVWADDGTISFSGDLVGAGSYSAVGDLDLNALTSGTQTGVGGTLTFTFSGATNIADGDYTFMFDDWLMGGSGPPNSFDSASSTISLWGDLGNYSGATCGGSAPSETCIGVDLRLQVTAVPLPASVFLLGGGLLGLFGTRRLKRSA